jgi:hypothetical protein
METEDSSPCSQNPTIRHYLETDKFSPYIHTRISVISILILCPIYTQVYHVVFSMHESRLKGSWTDTAAAVMQRES